MPLEQLKQPSNDVFNYTFNRNRISAAAEETKQTVLQEDPFQLFINREKPKEKFRINRPHAFKMQEPQIQLDRLERDMSQKYLSTLLPKND